MIGRRGGKNEAATVTAVDYAIDPSKYAYGADESPVIWWVGPTYTQTKKYGFNKIVNKLPPELIDGEPKRSSPFEISLKNGSQIECYSFDRPESLQGAGVDFMIIDEAAYMDETIWDNDLRPMLLDANGGAVFISKPLGENWFFDLYERGDDNNHSEWWSIHGTSYHNPWIDDAEIDQVKETTPEGVFRQQYLADPKAGGTLLTLDMLEYASYEVLVDRDRWNWHVAVDIGVKMDPQEAREKDTDYWAAAVIAEHPLQPQAYLVQVIRKRGQTPAQAAEWINMILSQVNTNRVYYESVAAQEWLVAELADYGIDPIAVTHDRPKEERLTFLSVPFNNGNIKLIDWNGRKDEHEAHATNDFSWSDFRSEWAGFPNGNHDDQLDATEMALRHMDFNGQFDLQTADPYDRDE